MSNEKQTQPLQQPLVMRWVAVTEQLPKEKQPILATNGKVVYYDVTLQRKDQFWIHFDGYHNDCWQLDDVTHWMPLPDPPCV